MSEISKPKAARTEDRVQGVRAELAADLAKAAAEPIAADRPAAERLAYLLALTELVGYAAPLADPGTPLGRLVQAMGEIVDERQAAMRETIARFRATADAAAGR